MYMIKTYAKEIYPCDQGNVGAAASCPNRKIYLEIRNVDEEAFSLSCKLCALSYLKKKQKYWINTL